MIPIDAAKGMIFGMNQRYAIDEYWWVVPSVWCVPDVEMYSTHGTHG